MPYALKTHNKPTNGKKNITQQLVNWFYHRGKTTSDAFNLTITKSTPCILNGDMSTETHFSMEITFTKQHFCINYSRSDQALVILNSQQ